jgi:hypothetical protein
VNPVLGVVPYGPEELDNFEIGLRSDWWQRRLIARVDYGWMDDYQRSREIRFQSTQEAFGLVGARLAYEPPRR